MPDDDHCASVSRREFLARSAAVAAAGLAGPSLLTHGAGTAFAASRAARPNVLFVFADQWRRQSQGYLGEDPVLTPRIDAYTREAVSLTNAVSGCPVCSPFRGSLMTGKYPSSHGVTRNPHHRWTSDLHLSPEHTGFAEPFRDAGYQTAYIGKWHLHQPTSGKDDPPDDGSDGSDAFVPPGPHRFGWDYWYAYNAHNYHRNPRYWKDSPDPIRVDQWSPAHETDVAIEYLKNRDAARPFCMMVSWNPPHPPFVTPQAWLDLYPEPKKLPLRPNCDPVFNDFYSYTRAKNLAHAQQEYFASVSSIDHEFGRLLDALRDQGVAEDTIVVLTSDHGEMLGSHSMASKNKFFEESAGVPMLIGFPGRVKPGLDDRLLINTPDLMPTVLGLAALDAPAGVEGTSFAPHLRGEKQELPEQQVIERTRHPPIPEDGWRAVRTHRYTYAELGCKPHRAKVESQWPGRWPVLFDRERDPYQLHPIYRGEGRDAVMDEMHDRLLVQLERNGDAAYERFRKPA